MWLACWASHLGFCRSPGIFGRLLCVESGSKYLCLECLLLRIIPELVRFRNLLKDSSHSDSIALGQLGAHCSHLELKYQELLRIHLRRSPHRERIDIIQPIDEHQIIFGICTLIFRYCIFESFLSFFVFIIMQMDEPEIVISSFTYLRR